MPEENRARSFSSRHRIRSNITGSKSIFFEHFQDRPAESLHDFRVGYLMILLFGQPPFRVLIEIRVEIFVMACNERLYRVSHFLVCCKGHFFVPWTDLVNASIAKSSLAVIRQ